MARETVAPLRGTGKYRLDQRSRYKLRLKHFGVEDKTGALAGYQLAHSDKRA